MFIITMPTMYRKVNINFLHGPPFTEAKLIQDQKEEGLWQMRETFWTRWTFLYPSVPVFPQVKKQLRNPSLSFNLAFRF